MLRGVNAVQERLQEHLRERAACSRAALLCSTGTILYRRYRTIRSSRGNLAAHRSARTTAVVELGSHDLKSSSLVGAASDERRL